MALVAVLLVVALLVVAVIGLVRSQGRALGWWAAILAVAAWTAQVVIASGWRWSIH